MPDPFITLTDLSDYLGRDVSADDGAVIALDAACDICRDIAEQNFNAGTATFVLDGTGTDSILLPQLPVVSVSAVTANGTAITDYTLNSNGILFRGSVSSEGSVYTASSWPEGRQNVSVTAVTGYATVDFPRSVRMVALSIASRLVVQGVALEESVGAVRMKYAVASTDLTAGERLILRKYRPSR
jgi:hypothetical protein